MPKAYIIRTADIILRSNISPVPTRNGYHCKNPLCLGRQKRVFTWWRRRGSPGATVAPARTRTCRTSTGSSAFCIRKTVLFDPHLFFINKQSHPKGGTVYWWRRRGSNSRPYGCEPYALPAELRPHIKHKIFCA